MYTSYVLVVYFIFSHLMFKLGYDALAMSGSALQSPWMLCLFICITLSCITDQKRNKVDDTDANTTIANYDSVISALNKDFTWDGLLWIPTVYSRVLQLYSTDINQWMRESYILNTDTEMRCCWFDQVRQRALEERLPSRGTKSLRENQNGSSIGEILTEPRT